MEGLYIFFNTALFFYLPSFIFVVFSMSSLSYGYILASLFSIVFSLIYSLSKSVRFKIRHLLCFILFSFLFSLYVLISGGVVIEGFAFILFVFSSFVFFNSIVSAGLYQYFLGVMRYNYWLMSFLSFVFCIGLNYQGLGYSNFEISVFPFSERSHFSLVYGLLLFIIFWTSKNYCYLLIPFLLAFFMPSATLILFIVFMVCFRLIELRKYVLSLLCAVLVYFLFLTSDYFLDRVPDVNTENLTALVFLQGYELAYNNMSSNFFLGQGFGNLGADGTILGFFSERIYGLYGKRINLEDGGLVFSKIVSEFGVIGLFFVFLYFFCIVKLLLFSSKYLKNNMSFALLGSFIIELFFRGYGYFSVGMWFLIGGGVIMAHRYKGVK